MKFCCLRARPHKTDIKELVATKAASHRLCLDQKAAPEHTAKITTDSQRACTFGTCGVEIKHLSTAPDSGVLSSSIQKGETGRLWPADMQAIVVIKQCFLIALLLNQQFV